MRPDSNIVSKIGQKEEGKRATKKNIHEKELESKGTLCQMTKSAQSGSLTSLKIKPSIMSVRDFY
jgi:hypothetical protein